MTHHETLSKEEIFSEFNEDTYSLKYEHSENELLQTREKKAKVKSCMEELEYLVFDKSFRII